jgi:hypothetical protein
VFSVLVTVCIGKVVIVIGQHFVRVYHIPVRLLDLRGDGTKDVDGSHGFANYLPVLAFVERESVGRSHFSSGAVTVRNE